MGLPALSWSLWLSESFLLRFAWLIAPRGSLVRFSTVLDGATMGAFTFLAATFLLRAFALSLGFFFGAESEVDKGFKGKPSGSILPGSKRVSIQLFADAVYLILLLYHVTISCSVSNLLTEQCWRG